MAEIDPTTVPELIIIKRIWTILSTYPPFADQIKPGNRLDRTLQDAYGANYTAEAKPVKQTADMIEVDIDLGRFNMSPQMVSFGNCNRHEDHVQNFVLIIRSEDEGVTDVLVTRTAILRALSAAGAGLGIPKSQVLIQNWSIPTTVDRKPSAPAGQVAGRRESALQLQVKYRIRY